MKTRLAEIIHRYVEDTKESNDMYTELCALIDPNNELDFQRECMSKREQILDINQWASFMISNRKTIRERVLWSMISDIQNRTTD